ncbi:MAG TPA: tRNA pseudouridine(38-40) synthase TruA [Vicinamibacterales bacterium]|nr:tRNA pseudouridine(38-40) synthase TruA [Vicinamibacterales bacterium]
MARFKLTLEYAGTRYSGWQKQKNARTVQGELETAMAETLNTDDFDCQGSGRTDAGVHALMQVAHLEARMPMPFATFQRRVNDALPPDINLLSIAKAPHRFHARHHAVGRSYLYQVARRRTAFAKPYVWWVKEPLDLAVVQAAAARFKGMHDFRSFSDDDPDDKSTAVLIDDVSVGEDGDVILIRIGGSHFLWKMVRRMVGVLVEAGRGGLTVEQIDAFLQESSPTPATLTAPSSGLFLERVFYEGDARDLPLVAAVPVRA